MPILLIQIITIFTNLVIFIAIILYFLKLRSRERELEEKERKADTNFHHVVDDALAKERKILEDASSEATHIITDAQYINQATKQAVDQALLRMAEELKKTAQETSQQFMGSYESSLKQVGNQSLGDFQTITKKLETDLQAQLQGFRESLLPNMEKELEAYKESRMKELEITIGKIVQKVSQDVLNKSFTIEDHHEMIIDSLERAKREGVFG